MQTFEHSLLKVYLYRPPELDHSLKSYSRPFGCLCSQVHPQVLQIRRLPIAVCHSRRPQCLVLRYSAAEHPLMLADEHTLEMSAADLAHAAISCAQLWKVKILACYAEHWKRPPSTANSIQNQKVTRSFFDLLQPWKKESQMTCGCNATSLSA